MEIENIPSPDGLHLLTFTSLTQDNPYPIDGHYAQSYTGTVTISGTTEHGTQDLTIGSIPFGVIYPMGMPAGEIAAYINNECPDDGHIPGIIKTCPEILTEAEDLDCIFFVQGIYLEDEFRPKEVIDALVEYLPDILAESCPLINNFLIAGTAQSWNPDELGHEKRSPFMERSAFKSTGWHMGWHGVYYRKWSLGREDL